MSNFLLLVNLAARNLLRNPRRTLAVLLTVAMGAVCVTDNLRHFLRVPGLIVENWLKRGKEG